MQVHVGYNKPVTYTLTPTTKRLGEYIARGSRVSIARHCLSNEAQEVCPDGVEQSATYGDSYSVFRPYQFDAEEPISVKPGCL